MSELIEKMASAMYWDRVNPNRGTVMLSVAVLEWDQLPETHESGRQIWHCKEFWRRAAYIGGREIVRAMNADMEQKPK